MTRRYFRPFATLALLCVLAGQLALLSHELSVVHHTGESCALCAVGERFSHTLPAPAHDFAERLAPGDAPQAALSTPLGRRPAFLRTRDPPHA